MKKLINQLEKERFLITTKESKFSFLKLKNTYPRLDFKHFTPAQVLKMFLGDSSVDTKLFLVTKYGLSLEYAELINEHLVFNNKESVSQKTETLIKYREALLQEGLLGIDPFAKLLFKGAKVILEPHLKHHSVLLKLLKDSGADITFLTDINDYTHPVSVFENGYEEIYFVLNEIARLLDSGINKTKINVVIKNDGYITLLERLAMQFGLLFDDEGAEIMSFPEINNLIKRFECNEIEFHEYFNNDDNFTTNPSWFVLNEYRKMNFKDLDNSLHFPYFKQALSKKKFRNATSDGLKIIRELPFFSEEDAHYFVLNFDNRNYPAQARVSPYLSNVERETLGFLTSAEIGEQNEIKTLSSLKNSKNVYLSFAKVFNGEQFELSTLVGQLEYEKLPYFFPQTIYSENYLHYLTGTRKDNYFNFDEVDENLAFLEASEKSRSYRAFDYQFKGLKRQVDELTLSYTNINLYQELPFDYFAQKLLRINSDAKSFSLKYGNFAHAVFEHSVDEASFDHSFYHYLDQHEFTTKEKYFVHLNYPTLKAGFNHYLAYVEKAKPEQIMREQVLSVKLNSWLTLIGKVDRLLLFSGKENKASVIIDFKTGAAKFEKSKIPFGLNLQLPIYGVLLSNHPTYAPYKPAALVLNSLATPGYSLSKPDLLAKNLKTSLRFSGMISNDPNLYHLIDPEIKEGASSFKTRILKDGTPQDFTSTEEFNDYQQIALQSINEIALKIKNNEFPVRKLQLSGTARSGQYSEYREISYLFAGEGNGEEESDE